MIWKRKGNRIAKEIFQRRIKLEGLQHQQSARDMGGAASGRGMPLDWMRPAGRQLELCTPSLARSYSVALSPSFFHPCAPALPPGSRTTRFCHTPRPIPSLPSPSPHPFPILVPECGISKNIDTEQSPKIDSW